MGYAIIKRLRRSPSTGKQYGTLNPLPRGGTGHFEASMKLKLRPGAKVEYKHTAKGKKRGTSSKWGDYPVKVVRVLE